MQVCWLLHSFLFSIIIDWITQCAFSNWLCSFLNGVKSRWCLYSQSMSNKSARAHTIHSHESGLSREFNQVTINSIIQFVYHRHTLCVCVCTCQRADVFTRVVFADSLLCDMTHWHIKAQTVFIWRLKQAMKRLQSWNKTVRTSTQEHNNWWMLKV